MQSLMLALICSLDTGIFCVAAGSSRPSLKYTFALVTAFGVCDTCATALGLTLVHSAPEIPAFTLYIACSALLGLAMKYGPKWCLGAPLVLSLDNLLTNMGTPWPLSTVWVPALEAGAASTVMAVLGISSGAQLSRYIDRARGTGGWWSITTFQRR